MEFKPAKIKPRTQTMDRWSSLPNALFFEILLRVPAVDILPMKLVCKEWYQMISSHELAEKQLTCGATRSQLSLLVMSCAYWHNSKFSFLYHHASWNFSKKLIKPHCQKMKLDFLSCRNPLSDYDHLFIKSSCNGLILAYDVNDANNITNRYPNRVLVFNPITRFSVEVAPPPIGRYEVYSWSIGYNDADKKYRIAIISAMVGTDPVHALITVVGLPTNSSLVPSSPWQKVSFTGNYAGLSCSLAAKGKFIWLVFTALPDIGWYKPCLIWLSQARQEAGEATRLALPKVYFEQQWLCKLYEANGRLRFLGPPLAKERIQMWETQDWFKMSNWYPIILIDCKPTAFLDYWNLSTGYSTCIIADYFAGERRELYHQMVQWMNSLASTYYIAAMFVHFDSLVSRV